MRRLTLAGQSLSRGLAPGIVAELREARRFMAARGLAGRKLRILAAARGARLDLVPAHVDVDAGLVLDLGANVGEWTAAVLQVFPSAEVVAVEPAEAPFRRLSERFAGNPRVRPVQAAVSRTPGQASLNITAHSHNASLLAPRPGLDDRYGGGWEVTGTETVAVTTVDELTGDGPVALLKIDVQGAEQDVLAGAARTLARVQAVLLEVTFVSHYRGDATFAGLHGTMVRAGFELVGMSSPYSSRQGTILWLDACYSALGRTG